MSDAPSLRDTIEAAMTSTPEPEPGETTTTEPVEAAPEPAADEASPETQADRARDEKGRFAKPAEKVTEKVPASPKGGEKAERAAVAGPQGKPVGASPTPAPTGQPVAPEPKPSAVKAPQAFKAAVRELATKLPAEFAPILEEAVRIDNEAKKALNDSAQARHLAQQVQQTIAPFESIARANGMDSMEFAGSVLRTAAQLQMGSPQQKAHVVAQIIGSYGVDIQTLATLLDGKGTPVQAPQQAQPPQDINRLVQEELDRRERAVKTEEAQRAWQEFVATEPEFLEDVRPQMVAILQAAGQQRRNITAQQAYDEACWMNPDVRSVLTQRDSAKKAADAARAKAPTVQQARAAAVSVRSTPVSAATRPSGPRSLREDIEAAVAGQRT